MPRIRSVKPEFWTDEKLSLLDPLTRLVFLGVICMADDAGRLVDNVKLLDGMIFPNTDDTCRDALDTLARIERVLRYRSSSGQALIQITNWSVHQKVDHPSTYNLPGPETAVVIQPAVPSAVNGAVTHESREPSEALARVSPSDPLPPIPDLGSSTTDQRPTTTDRSRVSAAAIDLAVAANQGLAEHVTPSRRQLVPRIIGTAAKTQEAAADILAKGVPIAFASAAIYELAKAHTAEGEVRSLKYFVDAVVRLHDQHLAGEQAKTTPRPRRNGNGGGGGLKAIGDDLESLVALRKAVAGNVDERRRDVDGDAWWSRMQREAKKAGKDAWIYASEHLKEPALMT